MDKILLALCYLISCFIVTYIMFQFMDERYHRTCQNRLVYFWSGVGNTVFMTILNLMAIPFLNLSAWMVLAGIGAGVLYHENSINGKKRIAECEALLIVITFTEAFGVLFVKWILSAAKVQLENPVMAACLEVTVSKVVVIFVYFTAIRGLVRKHSAVHGKMQKTTCFVIFLYSFVNMLVTIQGLSHDLNNGIFAVNMCGIVLVDLYLLYFIKDTDEKKAYDMKVQAMEQQAMLQQRYYKHLEEIDLGHRRYAHDLKNCMVSIAALAADGGNEEILSLIGDMEVDLDTLTGKRYTSNHILNAILWEKSVLADRQGVQMDIAAEENSGWSCIAGKDLIVMTGNLLDNAIEAAKQCTHGSVHVALHAQEHFLVMEVENTCINTPAVNGREKHILPVSTKPDAENHGFGIANVRDTAQKYGGLLYIEQNGDRFITILTIAKSCLAKYNGTVEK